MYCHSCITQNKILNYFSYFNYVDMHSLVVLIIIQHILEIHKSLIWSKIAKLGTGTYQCKECGLTKASSGLTALKNHVESKHLTGLVEYHCTICGKVLPNSNQYNKHLTKHRSESNTIRQ